MRWPRRLLGMRCAGSGTVTSRRQPATMARRLPVRRRSVLQRGLLGPAPVLRAMRCPQLLDKASCWSSIIILCCA
ncbi:hypothetical protein PAHAL_9G485300 [Panicum hallii]|uniref:Uncharacterized protein n=1 Tax=Panicum hallii TaxID=206008 RepID=A0A2T8I541_9POAL|nr:hypothetical protein PAHAL_9G485300 [Panicum hallii]